MRRLVIVGASLAGLRAAQAARAAGFDGELVMVGAEPHLPYTRPPLSKQLLAGAQSAEQCMLPHETVGAQWRLGVAASGLDRAHKVVRLADGDAVPYDRLILATGSRARQWPSPLPAEGLEGLYTLRSLDDAQALQGQLVPGARLLVVGAGFVGCEVAASARKLGVAVTLIDISPQPMLPLGPGLGRRCGELHRRHGVDLRLDTGVRRFLGEPRVQGAELTDGTRVEADAALIALGALPNSDWLIGSGLDLDPGVACDATLTALDDPDILAAGDLASWPHPLLDGARVRVEHWTTAAEHGQVAGRNALREPTERAVHAAPPYFWSDQYDLKIQAVGFPNRAESLEVLECSPDGERLVAAGDRGGRVVGVIAFNAARRLAWYRRQLATGIDAQSLRQLVGEDAGALGAPAETARI